MYWVTWSVSESPEFSSFSVHNAVFLYCLKCGISVSRGLGMVSQLVICWWSNVDSLLTIWGCIGTAQTSFGLISEGTVAVSWWSTGDPVLNPSRWSNVDSLLTWCSSSVLLLVFLLLLVVFFLLLAVFLGGLDMPGVLRCKLEESGHPWACLNGSRLLGLRQVLSWPTL